MLASILRHRMEIQQKTTTLGPLGSTESWDTISTLWARKIPLSVTTIAAYQQMDTVVSHKILLRGTVELNLSEHRIVHGSKTYALTVAAKHYDGVTEVIVSEV